MKTLMMSAAAAALIATGAMAQTATIYDDVEDALEIRSIDVPVATLSDEQVVQIYMLVTQGDAATDGSLDDRIAAIVDQEADSAEVADAMDEEQMLLREQRRALILVDNENSAVASVQNFLDAEGFEVDASTLSNSTVAEIYFEAFSDSDEPDMDEIETLLTM